MRKVLALISLLNFYAGICKGQDTLKTNRFIISTYPSNLLVGDVSLGIEHIYKKRWSQEAMLFIKCFATKLEDKVYDQGFHFTYQLKYNFISRKRFRMSGNVSFTYKHSYFNNKEDTWVYLIEGYPTKNNPTPLFLMDRSLTAYGLGAGISCNYRISRKIAIGSDLLIQRLKQQTYYYVKDPGKIDLRNYYIDGPYPPTKYLSPFNTYLVPFITLKISYQL